jgi:beta-galactosidase
MSSAKKVHFLLAGNGTIAGVGSGDERSLDSYSGDSFDLFNGRALIVVRASRQGGQIKLQATADGLEAASIEIGVKSNRSGHDLR